MVNISYRNFDLKGQKTKLRIEKYLNLNKLDKNTSQNLEDEIHALLVNCWGSFPSEFVNRHILGAYKMIVARINTRCIGLCVMNIREIFGLRIHYIEFLLVDKEFQKYGLGSSLSFMIIKEEMFKNIFSLLSGKVIEIFFITPNIRVLTSTAKIAKFIYPNPYLADDNTGVIPLADEETWKIASELLKTSDSPTRRLQKEGLVLSESYANTPWLIYNNDNAPWHSNQKINIFTKRYLGYHTGEDKEFMVRVHINFLSLIRYFLQS